MRTQLNNADFIIAIDPDVDKSGFAVLDVRHRVFAELRALSFPHLLDRLISLKILSGTVKVIVEAGWLNESNWHLSKIENKYRAASKGNAVGRNHEVGRKIAEMAKHYGLQVEEVKPLSKSFKIGRKSYNLWKGKDGKITHEEFVQITRYIGQTNQETRDAGLIAWQYADLPVTVSPQCPIKSKVNFV